MPPGSGSYSHSRVYRAITGVSDTGSMQTADTIVFRDIDTADEAVVMVRYDARHVVLAISLKSNGDIQAVMTKADAAKVMAALQRSLQ